MVYVFSSLSTPLIAENWLMVRLFLLALFNDGIHSNKIKIISLCSCAATWWIEMTGFTPAGI